MYKDKNRHREYMKKWGQDNKEHCRKTQLDRLHRIGKIHPMQESKQCSQYLGVYIAERVLSKFFDHIERMPFGNPGYDFVCGRGFKIDVKSGCLFQGRWGVPFWNFHIGRNTIADYFLCLGFNNREDLEPLHVWLIPGNEVNDHTGIGISNSPKSLIKWTKYERPLDKVIACCTKLREGVSK